MGEASDIADLLSKAARDVQHQKRMGWVKGLFALTSAFVGAAWSAHGYLSQLATKSDISNLEKQYAAAYETTRSRDDAQDSRLSNLEPRCSEAAQCCVRTNERLDRLTTPRIFAR